MNLITEAEWPLSAIDKDWLAGEVRRLLTECATVMRVVYPEMPADPVEAYLGTLVVHLYDQATPWGDSGNYISWNNVWGFHNPEPVSELAIAWYWHHTRKHKVIQFEGRNFWNHMLTGRGSFAHVQDGCPLIVKMKELIEEAYHANTDEPLPDVRLRHVSDLGKDL